MNISDESVGIGGEFGYPGARLIHTFGM